MDVLDLAQKVLLPAATLVAGLVGAVLRFSQRLAQVEERLAKHTATEAHDATWKREAAELASTCREIQDEVGTLRDEINHVRHSATDYAKDAELARFMMEQHERWEQINRSLGIIEGSLRKLPTPRR